MRNSHRAGVLLFALLMFLVANIALAQMCEETTTEPLNRIDELLIQADNQQAWQVLDEVPENKLATEVRLSLKARIQYEMGRTADKKPLAFFQKAEEYARAAIDENPNYSEGYKWLAVSLGAQAKYSETQEQVKISKEVKDNIEKAIELAPEDDISYLILSRWHYKNSALGGVARAFAKIIYGGLPKASLKESEKLLLHAISLHDRIAHRYNLAKVYERMERRDDARTQLEQALLLPVTFPEETKEIKKAKNKLEKWQ